MPRLRMRDRPHPMMEVIESLADVIEANETKHAYPVSSHRLSFPRVCATRRK
jgi:hypothetical protein